jgi:glycosyltransferase involved in cell wall biosynthesis
MTIHPLRMLNKADYLSIPANEVSDPVRLVKKPLVSVLMMTRNHEAFLPEAIESVVQQKCVCDFELLIGEDFSDDASMEVCRQFQQKHPDRIRLITADRNVGITPNFLRLVARARGEYSAFLEGDDYWIADSKLQSQIDLMNQHPEYSWCATRTLNRIFWAEPKQTYGIRDILRRYIFHTSSVFFRTDLLEQYPDFPDGIGWESYLFVYLSQHGDCGFIDRSTSYYRHHSGGMWTAADRKRRMASVYQFSDTMNEYLGSGYRKEISDREMWIVEMNVTTRPEAWNVSQWRENLGIVASEFQRVTSANFLYFTKVAIKVIFQPLLISAALLRRKLQIRNRLKVFFGRING